MTDLQVSDVALDLTKGRPVHVVERYDGDAADWSEANNYELTENYGNSRLGASETDAVFEVVYCSSAKSEPTKTYAMPEARLLRVETEAADGGRPVRERIEIELLADVLSAILLGANHQTEEYDWVVDILRNAEDIPDEQLDVAAELADIERVMGEADG